MTRLTSTGFGDIDNYAVHEIFLDGRVRRLEVPFLLMFSQSIEQITTPESKQFIYTYLVAFAYHEKATKIFY